MPANETLIVPGSEVPSSMGERSRRLPVTTESSR
jgi:hypothetical protein